MKNLHYKIVMYAMVGLVLTVAFHVRVSHAQANDSRILMVDRFLIKFSEQIVEMPDPRGKATPYAIIIRAAPLRSALLEIDPEMEVTRFRPDFQAFDTLRIGDAGQIIRQNNWSTVYRIRLTKDVNFFEIESHLEALDYVEWLDPPLSRDNIQLLYIPNDLHGEGNQWNIPKVQGTKVWDITRGDPGIRIQVMDSGISPHNDINNKMTNLGEPFAGFHGLAVAGVAGAETDNNLGIASLGFETSLVDASLERTGEPFDDMVARYFESSWNPELIDFDDLNADIINCSFFTRICVQLNQFNNCIEWESHNFNVIEGAVGDALDNDRIIVAAAGNEEDPNLRDNFPYTLFPAAYDGVIAVSASNSSDEFEDGYNYGNFVNLSAPAIDILLLDLNNQYDIFDGTSFASPLVAATVALMLDTNPSLTPAEVRTILEATAEEVGQYSYDSNGWNQYMGHGRLNAYEAVKHALPNQLNSPFFAVSPSQDIGGSHLFGESYLEYGTLIIPEGKAAVFAGNLIGFGADWAKIRVEGNMVVEEGVQLTDLSIEVAPTGRLVVRGGALIRPGSSGSILVEGSAQFGPDFTMRRGEIEVAAGGTLIVGAGSTLNFNSGASLTSYGKVEIGSYAGADVILKRDPNVGGTWAGVHLNGSGADGSVFHRTRVEGAVNGISITNADQITLNHTRAIDNTWDGIRLINTATGWLEWVTATGNGRYGIYIDGGTPGSISSTLLADNINAGINIEGAGWIWDMYTSRIRDNASQGLWARDAAFLGINFSSIHDNANYNAASWSGAEIIAWDNWWGQAPPDPNGFHTMTGGTLDYSGWLSQDPNQGILSVSEGETLAAVQDPAGQKPRIPPKPEQVRTLSDLRAELFHTPASERLARVEELSGGMDPAWQPWAQVVGLEMLQQAGRHRELVQAGGNVLAEAGLPAGLKRTIARRMFYSHLLGLQDAGQARAMIALLEELECEEAGSGQLSWLADFHGARFAESDEEPFVVLESGQSALQVSNHPNPFNPVTTLRYTLPEAGEVSLSVYNIQGQRVATLATGQHAQGTHSAVFDAGRLASGVYLYRLTTSAGVVTGKMLLIK
jgi:subtilisin family serine protease